MRDHKPHDRRIAPFAGALVATAVLLGAPQAPAFCRTTTVPLTGSEPADQCQPQGAPLFYPSQCIAYHVSTKAKSKTITQDQLSDALARAFATWLAPNDKCVPGIAAVELPPVDDAELVSYANGEPPRNLVGFVSPWTHKDGDSLELATVVFNADTGKILDADLEINDDIALSVSPTPGPDQYDLDTIVLHAVGHMLGLAHSNETDSVMWPTYDHGSTRRKLTADDVAGICTIYPSRATRLTASGLVASTACDLSPGATSGTCGDPNVTHGCAIAVPSSSSRGLGAGTLGALGIAALAFCRSIFYRRRR